MRGSGCRREADCITGRRPLAGLATFNGVVGALLAAPGFHRPPVVGAIRDPPNFVANNIRAIHESSLHVSSNFVANPAQPPLVRGGVNSTLASPPDKGDLGGST
mgnify:CR=1 FL=1